MQLDKIKQLNEKKKEEEEATGRGRNPTTLASPPQFSLHFGEKTP